MFIPQDGRMNYYATYVAKESSIWCSKEHKQFAFPSLGEGQDGVRHIVRYGL